MVETPDTKGSKIESRERPKGKPLFKVTLLRHEETKYTDIGRDLTPAGEVRAIETGKKLKAEGRFDKSDIILAHSPKPRAEGTLELVVQGAGITVKKKHKVNKLRMSDMPGRELFMKRVVELDHNQEAIAKDHHTNTELYENSPNIIEPVSKKRKRLYDTLESLVRITSWMKILSKFKKNAPYVLAVSHFELITLLIDDVFGIENVGKYNAPSFGEYIHIEAYETKPKSNKIRLFVEYNGVTKEVYFDRATLTIVKMAT